MAGANLSLAGLGFLGLEVQPPTAEWGSMLSDSQGLIFSAPYLIFIPGIAIMITVLAFNLLGDGLRDAMVPKVRWDGGGDARIDRRARADISGFGLRAHRFSVYRSITYW